MNRTKIEWVRGGYTWNPLTGCTRGCDFCYARRISTRFKRGFSPEFHENRIGEPIDVRQGSLVFVCSMGEVFDPDRPEWQIDRLWDMMQWGGNWHTYLILTKQPERMREFMSRQEWQQDNIWLGVSVTNQADADERIPILLSTPAAKRFVSVEPIHRRASLGVYLPNPPARRMLTGGGNEYVNRLDWVIVGAETGNRKGKVVPGRAWIESIVNDCKAAQVPVFLKGSLASIWGEPLIQEWPEEAATP